MNIPFQNIPIQSDFEKIKGKALKGAFLKGAIACREAGNIAKNPYKAKYKPNGSATFAMAFRNAWDKGFNSYLKHKLN